MIIKNFSIKDYKLAKGEQLLENSKEDRNSRGGEQLLGKSELERGRLPHPDWTSNFTGEGVGVVPEKLGKLTEVLREKTGEWGIALWSMGQTRVDPRGSPEHCWQPLHRNKKDETPRTRKKNPFLWHCPSSSVLY